MTKAPILSFLIIAPAFAQSIEEYSFGAEPITIVGKSDNFIGETSSASQGQANNEELSQRPVLRRGELLEVIPGVIVTQHAGGGKANQYFLRGFNLDHGTDFHVGVDGAPANYRTHAHGQGYADINFVVPEFIERLDYFKGPFFAEHGDLSTAGGADYHLVPYLDHGIASVTYGEYDYVRLLVGDSWEAGQGILTLGAEFTHEDGPWDIANDYNRYNAFAKWYMGDKDNFLSITGLFHDGTWNSSDQIPERAVNNGSIGIYSAIDDSTGGETDRHTLSLKMKRTEDDWGLRTEAWVGTYALDLFSNFSYFTDTTNGDQFEQDERRIFSGFNIVYDRQHTLFDLSAITEVGLQTKHDWINDIGLYNTTNRVRTNTINVDDVYEGSYGVFIENELFLNDRTRLISGLRGDLFYFDVESQDTPADTNDKWDAIISPNLGLAYTLTTDTELYLNGGLGFHSNDARGVTASVDPVEPLVRTKGAELGLRTQALKDISANVSLWMINSDSEFVYVGDEGKNEAGPASTRHGVETSLYWRPSDSLTVDLEHAWSFARLDVPAGEFDEIDNSVPQMASAGITFGDDHGWYSALRARYLSSRPLVGETSVVDSKESLQVNARIGYKWHHLDLSLDVLNLLDRNDRDIEYNYESQLAGETTPVEDIHFHPTPPRQIRLNATLQW